MKPEPSDHLQPEPDESSPHASNLLIKNLLMPNSYLYLYIPRVQSFVRFEVAAIDLMRLNSN